MLKAIGDQVVRTDDGDVHAVCKEAQRAADMLNKAYYLNDVKRKYTAAARLICKVEQLDGFHWLNT